MAEKIQSGPGRDRETQKNLLRKVINVLNVNRDVQRNDTKKQTDTLHDDNADIINAIAIGNKHLMDMMKKGKVAEGDKLEEKKERTNLFKKIASIPSSIKTNISDKLSNLKEKLTPKNPFSGLLSGVKGMLGGAAKMFIPLLAIGALIGTPLFDGKRFKDNVLALLDIGNHVGLMELLTLGAFPLAMKAIAKGLLMFSVGAAGVGITQGILDKFGQKNWAQGIKDNILTLLSIGNSLDLAKVLTGAVFVPAMTMIAKGLAIFSAGAGVVAGVEYAIKEYFGVSNWAQGVKDNVLTLLSIGGEGIKGLGETLLKGGVFVGSMIGIAAGLAAFAVGKGIASFIEPDFGAKIKNNVDALLSIANIENLEGKSVAFKAAMSNLSDGLSSFAKGGFVSSLANAGTAIAGFFTGQDGSSAAFDEILKVADKSAEIDKSAEAINKLSSSLEGLNGLTMPEISLGLSKKTLVEFSNLSALITGLSDGGSVEYTTVQGRQRKLNFGKSILDPGMKFEEVRAKVQIASQILDGGQIGRGVPMAASTQMRENTDTLGELTSKIGTLDNTNVNSVISAPQTMINNSSAIAQGAAPATASKTYE